MVVIAPGFQALTPPERSCRVSRRKLTASGWCFGFHGHYLVVDYNFEITMQYSSLRNSWVLPVYGNVFVSPGMMESLPSNVRPAVSSLLVAVSGLTLHLESYFSLGSSYLLTGRQCTKGSKNKSLYHLHMRMVMNLGDDRDKSGPSQPKAMGCLRIWILFSCIV